jgi:hypothetical protein
MMSVSDLLNDNVLETGSISERSDGTRTNIQSWSEYLRALLSSDENHHGSHYAIMAMLCLRQSHKSRATLHLMW